MILFTKSIRGIAFTVLFFYTLPLLKAQISDYIEQDRISTAEVCAMEVDSLVNEYGSQKQKIAWFKGVQNRYCLLTHYKRKQAVYLLNFSLNKGYSIVGNKFVNFFFLRSYSCFDGEEKARVKDFLRENIRFNDPFYFELVSLFQLETEEDYLRKMQSTTLFHDIVNDLQRGKIHETSIISLKSMAALANIGSNTMEDSLLNIITDLYGQLDSTDSYSYTLFYLQVLPNSIGLLHSKRAVLETMYMLDESQESIGELYEDVAGFELGLEYFIGCIQPKLTNSNMIRIARIDFQKYKSQIKHLLLTDDSIWHSYIRLK